MVATTEVLLRHIRSALPPLLGVHHGIHEQGNVVAWFRHHRMLAQQPWRNDQDTLELSSPRW